MRDWYSHLAAKLRPYTPRSYSRPLVRRTGDYTISTPLQPLPRQSWQLPYNATF